jgi:predicted DCC family thiol-disulfide oxidoreductase YuxK
MTSTTNPLVLYDGHCALCNGWVRILLALDRAGTLRFAALQSEFARGILEASGLDPDGLETVVFLEGSRGPSGLAPCPGETPGIHRKSDAIFAAIAQLDAPLKYLRHGRHLPRFLRDGIYDFIAAHRHAWFGRHERCPLPEPGYRDRFLDLD